jgi:hypothetical protein
MIVSYSSLSLIFTSQHNRCTYLYFRIRNPTFILVTAVATYTATIDFCENLPQNSVLQSLKPLVDINGHGWT